MADDAATHDAAIAAICEFTGADAATAEHVLDAHGWALDAAVAFHLESGGAGERPPAPRSDSPVIVSGGGSPPYVMVDEDEVRDEEG